MHGEPDNTAQQHIGSRLGSWHQPPLLYPLLYLLLIVLSALDIVLTWVVLALDGSEINPIAAMVIDHWGLPGAIAFKFSLILVVILACESIGRQAPRTGQRLALVAVGIAAVPVVYTLALLMWHAMQPGGLHAAGR